MCNMSHVGNLNKVIRFQSVNSLVFVFVCFSCSGSSFRSYAWSKINAAGTKWLDESTVHPANAVLGAGVVYSGVGSFSFSGSGTSYVELPLTVVGGGLAVSIATWIQPTTCTAGARIVDFGTGSVNSEYVYVSIADSSCHIKAGWGTTGAEYTYTSTSTLTIGTWSFLVVVRIAGFRSWVPWADLPDGYKLEKGSVLRCRDGSEHTLLFNEDKYSYVYYLQAEDGAIKSSDVLSWSVNKK